MAGSRLIERRKSPTHARNVCHTWSTHVNLTWFQIRLHQKSATVILFMAVFIWSRPLGTEQIPDCQNQNETSCKQAVGCYWNASANYSTASSSSHSTINGNSGTASMQTASGNTGGSASTVTPLSQPSISVAPEGPSCWSCGTIKQCTRCTYTTEKLICDECAASYVPKNPTDGNGLLLRSECELQASDDSNPLQLIIIGVVCGVVVVALVLALVLIAFRCRGSQKSCPSLGGGGGQQKPTMPRPDDCNWPPPPSAASAAPVNRRKISVKQLRYTRTPSKQEQNDPGRQPNHPGTGRQAIPSVVYDDPQLDVTAVAETPTEQGSKPKVRPRPDGPAGTSTQIYRQKNVVSIVTPSGANNNGMQNDEQEVYQNFNSDATPMQSMNASRGVQGGRRANEIQLETAADDELYTNGSELQHTINATPFHLANGNGGLHNAALQDDGEVYGNVAEFDQQTEMNDGGQEIYANAEAFSPAVAQRPIGQAHVLRRAM